MKNEYDYLNDVKMDFSCYKEETISEKEFDIMRHTNKKTTKTSKKVFIIAACVAILTFTTAYASGLMENVIKTIKTGFNSYVQVDPQAPHPLIDGLQGKIFDENGNPLASIRASDFDHIYDKDGNKITKERFVELFEEATGTTVMTSEKDDAKVSEKVFATLDDAQEHAVFDIKTPAYLPEDYKISKIFTYKDENGASDGQYLTLEYQNSKGKNILIFERILNEETAFEAGTDGTLEEISINGRTAVITNDVSLGFETADNVSVTISTHGNISKDELIKIAEGIE